MDADAQNQQKQVRHSHSSSTFSFFSDQPIPGIANGNYGGGRLGQDMLRRSFEMKEAIRREIEKERIREEIIAEVRNEMMMEREIAMRSAGGYSSPLIRRNMFEPEVLHWRPIGQEVELAMSVGRSDCLREIRGFPVSPLQPLEGLITPLLEDNKKEAIVLSTPNHENLSRTKRKSLPQVCESSSQPGAKRSKKKVKEEWSCAICQVSTTSERGLTEHFQGKKHQAKEVDLVAYKSGASFGLGVAPKKPIIKPVELALTTVNPSPSEEERSKTRNQSVNQTSETNKSSSTSDPVDKKSALPVSEDSSQPDSDGSKKKVKEKWSCAICQVRVTSERGLHQHLQGKKHQSKEVALVAHTTRANSGLAVAPINPSSSVEKRSETRKESVKQTPEANKTSSTSNLNHIKEDEMTGENKSGAFKLWCEMCHVGTFSETVMNAHKKGKKHSTRLVELYRKGKVDSEASAASATCEDTLETETNQIVVVEMVPAEIKPVKDDMECVIATSNTCEDKHETKTNETVIVETVPAEVKSVEDDMKCVTAVVAEEKNIRMTAGFVFC
ncbi:hypothetical protein QVD17_22911 [Tagetes erecta]|uniref:C2H2-type domain-containing protein n=1 Tax=Tagetes erecta TaxID=13708 RepID=A0AAD8KDG1_TARER|nr:hypothetical protein QVD17_22911 [Tagetes erecta]